jgi:RNA polymerase sigma-70 factor (ECF subfamily)
MMTEQQLIASVKAGNEHAYRSLVAMHQSLVFTMVYRRVNSHEDAEEIAQDVFVKAYKYIASFKGDAKLSTWLCSIANNSTSTFLSKRKLVFNELNERHEQHEDSQALSSTEEEQLTLVEKAMLKLPKDDAQIISLFYQGEQSLAEIAAILQMETNAVKVKLHRARVKLKTIIEQLTIQK